MTSQIIMIFNKQPTFMKIPCFPIELEDFIQQGFYHGVLFTEYNTDVKGVCILRIGGRDTTRKAIGTIRIHGLIQGIENEGILNSTYITLKKMVNDAKEYSWKDIPIETSKWYLVVETHDAFVTLEFAYLLLALFDDEARENVQILDSNFSDETERVKKWGMKIINLHDDTNPLLNPDAVLVFEIYPRAKRRVIAYKEAPTKFNKLKIPTSAMI